jgi:hypothetical protein
MIGPVVTLCGAVLTLFFCGLVWAFMRDLLLGPRFRRSGFGSGPVAVCG